MDGRNSKFENEVGAGWGNPFYSPSLSVPPPPPPPASSKQHLKTRMVLGNNNYELRVLSSLITTDLILKYPKLVSIINSHRTSEERQSQAAVTSRKCWIRFLARKMNDENDINGTFYSPRSRQDTTAYSSNLPCNKHITSSSAPSAPSCLLQCALYKAIYDSDSDVANNRIPTEKDADTASFPTMRMILKGPSQSGKTSLAMNAAYSIASSSSTATVIFLIPESKRSILDFPLSCRGKYTCFQEKDKDNDPATFNGEHTNEHDKHQQFLEHIKAMDTQYNVEQHDYSQDGIPHSKWDSKGNGEQENDALQRIHIKYIKSAHDLVQALANIQQIATIENRHETQPMVSDSACTANAIIVDDLDYYITGEATTYGSREAPALQDMKLIQLLAILADTCNHLDEISSKTLHSPIINHRHRTQLVVCLNTDRLPQIMHKSKSIYPLIQNYTPTVVSIERKEIHDIDVTSICLQEQGQCQELPKCLSAWTMRLQHVALSHPDLIQEYHLCTEFFIGIPFSNRLEEGYGGSKITMQMHESREQYDDEDDERELYWKL